LIPRVALSTATSTNLTGASITGTALTLTTAGNGAIIEDRHDTYARGGEIVIVRSAASAIVGAWIVEDNTYTLDDGGTALPAGGWRVAAPAVCAPVTFERWYANTWPGHDTPRHTTPLATFCALPGDVYQVDVMLPVQMLGTPQALAADGAITLTWSTASETDNARFDIVRNGEVVGHVTGADVSAVRHDYSWTESNLTNGQSYSYTLRSVNGSGESFDIATVSVVPNAVSAIVTEYALRQNYPNPFNPTTSIGFDLVDAGYVTLTVFNPVGQEVARLVDGIETAGRHEVTFSATDMTSGIYFYQLEVNGFVSTHKMLLMK
jgi:hypothetical protein